MNIFDDLIEELKEENLLEEPIVRNDAAKEEPGAENKNAAKVEGAAERETADSEQAAAEDFVSEEEKLRLTEANFYRQKAMSEVAFLQTVEQVFAAIEREQLKIVPNPFDDLRVKKALQEFVQVSDNLNTPEYAKAQFQLLKETENWHSILANRDKDLMTAHLRRYCENSRPPLSSSALVALARFYRNSPYSEQTRSKFDLIATRLFSKEIGGDKREMVFSREELVQHLKDLYAEWSSVPLYSTEVNNPHISQTVQQFKEFIKETGDVMKFDELINGNFFNRLHRFKESTNEDFYEPSIAAVAIEGNIRIGNRYIDLLEKAKKSGDVANLKSKYGIAHDRAISEAAGKTLTLIELLEQKKETSANEPTTNAARPPREEKSPEVETAAEKFGEISKWMIAAAVIAVFVLGIYFITNSDAGSETVSSAAEQKTAVVSPPKENLQTSILKDYLQEAFIQDETLNGVVLPSWSSLTEQQKKDALAKMLKLGDEKGYKKVKLIVKDKAIATAGDGNVSVIE